MAVNPAGSFSVIQNVDAGALAVGMDGFVAQTTAAPTVAAPVTTRPARLAPGFTEAFDGLYLGAYRTAYRLLGNRQEAEDVAQEACARACLRWSRLDDPAAWVARVSANLASIVGGGCRPRRSTGPSRSPSWLRRMRAASICTGRSRPCPNGNGR